MLKAESSLDGLTPALPSASRKARCAGVTTRPGSSPRCATGGCPKVCASVVPGAAVSDGGIPMVAITSSPMPQPLAINAAHAIAALAVSGRPSCTSPTYRLVSADPRHRLLRESSRGLSNGGDQLTGHGGELRPPAAPIVLTRAGEVE